jgi:putative ABC transport system ATP-binding protein
MPIAEIPFALATAPPGAEVAVRIRRLNHFFFKDRGQAKDHVLKDLDLEFARGEVVILTGPSGCGKTTLLTLIGGLRSLQGDSKVNVFGRELSNLNSRQLQEVRYGIGFIFQRHNLLTSLTAYQNVKMAMDLRGIPAADADARIRELMELLLLKDAEKDRTHFLPKKLSGGQCQRVAIARALANRPNLVLADEPTAALDERSSQIVFDELKRLAHEHGATIVIVTHDDRILAGADRIVSLRRGKIASNLPVAEAKGILKFLNESGFFGPQTLMTLADVIGRMSRADYADGEVIIRQGKMGDRMFLIRSGTVDVQRDTHDGSGPQFVTALTAGTVFGEQALLTAQPRNATVIARGTVETYVLQKDEFEQAKAENATFREQLTMVAAQRS